MKKLEFLADPSLFVTRNVGSVCISVQFLMDIDCKVVKGQINFKANLHLWCNFKLLIK